MKVISAVLDLALLVACASPTYSGAPRLARAALLDDARQLKGALESAHPDPYGSGGGKIAFERRFHELLASIPVEGMTLPDFYRLLLPFVASVGDGHTAILRPQNSPPTPSGFPLRFGIVEGSLVVKNLVTLQGESLLGARLRDLEGVGFEELLRRQRTLRGIENVYGAMALVSRSLLTREGLALLVPEWKGHGTVSCGMLLPDGRSRDLEVPLGEGNALEMSVPPSAIAMPDPEASDIAFTFLDASKRTALLVIRDMMAYREACEIWFSDGLSEAREFTRAAYSRFHGGEPPSDSEQLLKGVPSATEAFRDLGVAMKAAATDTLIVDVRDNGGGNGAMIRMLLYFLFGDKAMREYGEGYSIARYSDLFFQVYSSIDIGQINGGRAVPLQIGDYDFVEEERFKRGTGGAEDVDAELRKSPTFHAIYATGRFAGIHKPRRIIVLSSALTYSSGFNLMAALKNHGAILVGTPSAQPGNNYGDSLVLRLKNSGIQAFVAYKLILTYPDDPTAGRVVAVDHPLTYAKLASYGFDPNAEVLLALETR